MDSSASDCQHGHHYNNYQNSEVKGCRFRVITWIRVDYEQYLIYGHAIEDVMPTEEVNDTITFEQSTFSKIDESKTLEVSCQFC